MQREAGYSSETVGCQERLLVCCKEHPHVISSDPSFCLLQELLKSFKGLDNVQRSDGGDLSMHGRTTDTSCHCKKVDVPNIKYFASGLHVRNETNSAVRSAGLVSDSVNRCDADLRRDLFNGVLLAGRWTLSASVMAV